MRGWNVYHRGFIPWKSLEPLADSRFKYSPRCLPKAPSVFQHWRPPGYGTKLGRSGFPCSGATKLTLYGSEYVLQCILMVTQLQYRYIGAIRILFYGVMYILHVHKASLWYIMMQHVYPHFGMHSTCQEHLLTSFQTPQTSSV